VAEQTFIIPLVSVPQEFEIELSGISLLIVCVWNEEQPAWELNIYDGLSRAPLITTLPIVSGVDLLSQFAHIGIPGKLIALTEGDELMPPTLDNLGVGANLYYIVDVA
jgi:hypothetical protein